jgi:hypothetical protein
MLSGIQAELFRLSKSKALWIIGIAMVASILATTLVPIFIEELLAELLVDGNATFMLGMMNLQGSNVANFLAEGNNPTIEIIKTLDVLVFFFLAVILIVWINDINDGTIRNLLSLGHWRKRIYVEKLLTSFITCILLVVIYYFLAFLISGILIGFELPNLFLLKIFIGQLIIFFSIIATSYLIGLVTRNKPLFIAIYLLYPTIFLNLIAFPVRIGILSGDLSRNMIAYAIDPYTLLSSVAWNLSETSNGISSYSHSVVVGLFILVITTIVGISIFERRDIV